MPSQNLDTIDLSAADTENQGDGDYSSLDSIYDYLQSKEGNIIVNRILGFI